MDLFCGCGGLTLGVGQALHALGVALDVPLAVDFEETATKVYAENFPKAAVETATVESFFDGGLGAALTTAEKRSRKSVFDAVDSVQLLLGGPPCQGHSDLNNHTRRNDPKNRLYARMARAAQVLEPTAVVIENVPAVQHDSQGVVNETVEQLADAGYDVATRVVSFARLGVAQTRKRHVLLAVDGDDGVAELILKSLAAIDDTVDLRWAIDDLASDEGTGMHKPPRASDDNAKRMAWLIKNDAYDLPNWLRPQCHQDGDHSYKSMYGRLSWDQPAQTITSGYGSIGQGRYMHPDLPRALTAHEAARIQDFPDYFSFGEETKRAELATLIGNAVPPALTRQLVPLLMPYLDYEIFDVAD